MSAAKLSNETAEGFNIFKARGGLEAGVEIDA